MRSVPSPIPARRTRRPPVLPLATVLTLALAPALWACGSGDGEGAGLPWPEPSPTETTAGTTGPGGPALPGDVLTQFDTSGTITGEGIGALEVSTGGELRYTGVDGEVESDSLTSDELDELAGLLSSADFGSVPTEPDIDDVCPDALVVTVTYQRWEVTADDCTVPTEIEPVVDRLRELLARFL